MSSWRAARSSPDTSHTRPPPAAPPSRYHGDSGFCGGSLPACSTCSSSPRRTRPSAAGTAFQPKKVAERKDLCQPAKPHASAILRGRQSSTVTRWHGARRQLLPPAGARPLGRRRAGGGTDGGLQGRRHGARRAAASSPVRHQRAPHLPPGLACVLVHVGHGAARARLDQQQLHASGQPQRAPAVLRPRLAAGHLAARGGGGRR
jgi:hypothetical protein